VNLEAEAPKDGDADVEVERLTLEATDDADRLVLAELANVLFDDPPNRIRETIEGMLAERSILADCPSVHLRKCHDCSSVAYHADNVTPHVLCKKCGSQDTRKVKA
jgi:hypothetical protein